MRRSGGLGGALGTPRAGNARACCVHSEDSPRAVRPNRVTMPPCNASRVVQDDPTARGAPVGCALAPWLARLRGRCGSERRHKGQPHHCEDNPRVPAALGRPWPTAQLAPDDGPLPPACRNEMPACRKAKRVLQKTQSHVPWVLQKTQSRPCRNPLPCRKRNPRKSSI